MEIDFRNQLKPSTHRHEKKKEKERRERDRQREQEILRQLEIATKFQQKQALR
jgi:hypothetical protein